MRGASLDVHSDADADRAGAHVYGEHRAHVGDAWRGDLWEPHGQGLGDVVGGVTVVDVVDGDLRAAVADHLGDLIDHRRVRLGGGADALTKHQPAVDVDA